MKAKEAKGAKEARKVFFASEVGLARKSSVFSFATTQSPCLWSQQTAKTVALGFTVEISLVQNTACVGAV